MTSKEYAQVAGRFMTIERGEGFIIVGLLGSLHKADLTRDQIRHIKSFCGRSFYKHHWLKDYTAPINASMYNDYMYIDTRNPLPDCFNQYQKADFWKACEKIDGIETPEDFQEVMWDLGFYSEEVVKSAMDYMGCHSAAQYR